MQGERWRCSRRGLPEEPVPRGRREAEPERVDRLLAQAAGGEIVAGGLRLRGTAKAITVAVRRPGDRGEDRRFFVGREAAAAAGQVDACPLRQLLEGLTELEPFHLHQEAEDIAPDVADPAAEGLSLWVDLEAGAGVLVPWAQPHHGLASPPQGKVCPHQVDDVDRIAHAFLQIVVRTRWC